MKKENTLVLVKPDGLLKSLTGGVLSRLSETGLVIIGTKVIRVTEERAKAHYSHLSDRPFFPELIDYIMGEHHHTNRVLALVYHGENAIEKVRRIVGDTNPEEASPISIRGAFGRITTKGVFENVVHASSSLEESEREIKLWFTPDEIVYDIYPFVDKIKTKIKVKVWS